MGPRSGMRLSIQETVYSGGHLNSVLPVSFMWGKMIFCNEDADTFLGYFTLNFCTPSLHWIDALICVILSSFSLIVK